jgi:hypothetical protein
MNIPDVARLALGRIEAAVARSDQLPGETHAEA